MSIININEAKTRLSRLVKKAAAGDAFNIAKAGKPMVKVVPVDTNHTEQRRSGFLLGQIDIPDDFDTMGDRETAALFGGGV